MSNRGNSPKHIIFFVRHTNDLDHISPVISALGQNYPDSANIRVILARLRPNELLASRSPKSDPRLQYLEQSRLNLEYPAKPPTLFRCFFSIFQTVNQPANSILVRRVARPLVQLTYSILYAVYLQNLAEDYCIKVIRDAPTDSIVVMDHAAPHIYQQIVKISNERGIVTVALPHGLTFFYQEERINERLRKRQHDLNIFDYVVVPNEFHRKQYIAEGLCNSKMIILGSARFCSEWMDVVTQIYPAPFKSLSNKLCVLFLYEKGSALYDGVFQEVSDVEEQFSAVKYLSLDSKIELVVKVNTRGIKDNQWQDLVNLDCLVVDKQYDTPALISWADLVISGGGTSVLADPIVRGKAVIVLPYLHPFKLVYEEYNTPWIVKSASVFRDEVLPTLSKYNLRVPYTASQTSELISDFIAAPGNLPNKSVLDTYATFLYNLR